MGLKITVPDDWRDVGQAQIAMRRNWQVFYLGLIFLIFCVSVFAALACILISCVSLSLLLSGFECTLIPCVPYLILSHVSSGVVRLLFAVSFNPSTERLEWGRGAENAAVENAGVDKVWQAVRIKHSQVSANWGAVGLAYCRCKAASESTLLVCISRLITTCVWKLHAVKLKNKLRTTVTKPLKMYTYTLALNHKCHIWNISLDKNKSTSKI